MKVKSLLKISGSCISISVMEPIKVEGQEEMLIEHDVKVAAGRKDIEKVCEHWIKYSHTCFLPKEVVNKEIDMVSTDHKGALIIYTK